MAWDRGGALLGRKEHGPVCGSRRKKHSVAAAAVQACARGGLSSHPLDCLLHLLVAGVGVDLGGLDVGMAEEFAGENEVTAGGFVDARGGRVAEAVGHSRRGHPLSTYTAEVSYVVIKRPQWRHSRRRSIRAPQARRL